MFTLNEGQCLVRYARNSIKAHMNKDKVDDKDVSFAKEKQGVFVTLLTYPKKELRGCIGFVEPIYPLNEAVHIASISAAIEDLRFLELKIEELEKIVVEVSVLTVPEKIELAGDETYDDKITIGVDGLIIKGRFNSGLLLPQVPVEFGWDKKQFLMQSCVKAGLSSDAYLSDGVDVYKFRAQIFSESSPSGSVVEKRL